jgi:hypothetical protein
MKKYAYATNGCDLCGCTVHAHEQEILALVGLNNFIHEALYICPTCKCAADNALGHLAKKLNAEAYAISISALGLEDPRTVMTRKLQLLLKADLRALSSAGLCRSPKARATLNRLHSRLCDLQIIRLGYYSVDDLWSRTNEILFTDRGVDSILKLSMLKRILCTPVYYGRMCYEVAVVTEYFSEPPISYLLVPGDSVAISLQLANLINNFGAGVIDIAINLQSAGFSPFVSVEQCVHILDNFSLAEAEDYAENYPAVRKQLKL